MTIDLPSRVASLTQLGSSWIMWLLVGLSVLALAVIIERASLLFLGRGAADACRRDISEHLRHGDLDGARERARQSHTLEAQVFTAGAEGDAPGPAAAEQRLAAATQLAKLQLERRLAFLGTLGTNAPFIGLLGTVIGIIRAFRTLDSAAGKVTAGLMSEVGEALVATAIGILVALPAIAAFNLFQRVVKTRLVRIEAMGRELVAALSTERL